MLFPFHDDHPTVRFPIATISLIAINVIVFVATLGLPPEKREMFYLDHGFVPLRVKQLTNANAPITVPMSPAIETRRVEVGGQVFIEQREQPRTYTIPAGSGAAFAAMFSSMFLHGGWMHLIGNMWFLWIFGNNVEDRLSPLLYIVFYFVGGLLALAAHWFVSSQADLLKPVIGASGAVSAVLGAYVVMYPRARVRSVLFLFIFITIVELPAYVVLGVWFLGQLFDGLGQLSVGVSGGVAFWAHIGGFAAGALLMPMVASLVRPPTPPDPPRVARSDPFFGA
jgi:membrane associated rhomboid family serine protease